MGDYLKAGDTFGAPARRPRLTRARLALAHLAERWKDRRGDYFQGGEPESRHWLRVWWQDDVRGRSSAAPR